MELEPTCDDRETADVTVIVAAYNAADTLARTVDSVHEAREAGVAARAIVVDDASTDETLQVARELATQPWIDVIAHGANGGPSAARNTGLAAATTRWVLFLDADDVLLPGGLAALLTAAGHDRSARWWAGGWQLTMGATTTEYPAAPLADPVDRIAAGCPFAIHAALVDRTLVREVGGFDPALRTCEDWDLWRRLAMAGHQPRPVAAMVADYVVRRGSASRASPAMLHDGLVVIDRAHAGRIDGARRERRAAWAAYVSGLACVAGADAAIGVLDGADLSAPDADPETTSDMLSLALLRATGRATSDWPVELAGPAAQLLSELERRTGAPGFAARCMHRVAAAAATELGPLAAPIDVGSARIVDVDLAAGAPAALPLQPGVTRVLVRAIHEDAVLAIAEIAPLHDQAEVAPDELIGALVDRDAWGIFLAIGLGETPPEAPWDQLLAMVLGRGSGAPQDAYDAAVPVDGPVFHAPGGRIPVDLLALPGAVTGLPALWVDATLAGRPLHRWWIAARGGQLDGGRLRQQLLMHSGVAIVRAALQAWLTDPERGTASLADWLEGARRRVDPSRVISDPGAAPEPVPADAEFPIAPTRRRSAASFEALFASEVDPWAYASDYERRKYEQTLSLLPRGAKHVLELACAEGRFTELLAPRVDRLVAADVAPTALHRAAERCADYDHVEYLELDLFRDPIPAGWDAVFCSEVLYYAGEADELPPIANRIARAIRPGGALIAAHANLVVDDPAAPGFDWDEAFGALGIERALLATGLLELEHSIVTPMYRVQRYRRRGGRRWRRTRAVIDHAEPAPITDPAVAEHFLPHGRDAPREVDDDGAAGTRSVPILMYHRVAPRGAEAMRRWRVTPEEFAAQLDFLARAGFQSITAQQWLDAVRLGRPLPEQPVMLTFDDAYADVGEHARPALESHGFTATVLAVSGCVGGVNAWDADREEVALLSWDGLRDLSRAGFEIGGHTRTHRPLTALDGSAVADEIDGSMRAVGEQLGIDPVAFAYPYGDMSDAIRRLAGQHGAGVAFSCRPGIATDDDDLLALPRIEVRGDRPFEDFAAQLRRQR